MGTRQKIKILLVGYNGARNTDSDVRVTAIARRNKKLLGKDCIQITIMTLDGRLDSIIQELSLERKHLRDNRGRDEV
ncbi:MAG: hypothetical protein NC094_06410 [Bacteroidales bacterium]|nr:hypothetical protein [Lachnoclostridium sp.]MCM1465036.1 hypothetical protein [Bacteroidales bacterium]